MKRLIFILTLFLLTSCTQQQDVANETSGMRAPAQSAPSPTPTPYPEKIDTALEADLAKIAEPAPHELRILAERRHEIRKRTSDPGVATGSLASAQLDSGRFAAVS